MYYNANYQVKFTGIHKPKYASVELISIYNSDYRAKRTEYIAGKQIQKTIIHTPCQGCTVDLAGRYIETFLQRLEHQSIHNRVLSYKVCFQGNYIQQYRDLDLIKIESDGSVTIAEIKVTSNIRNALKKAIKQLSRNIEILYTIFKKVNPKIIIIDLSDVAMKSAKQLHYKFNNCLECVFEYYSYPEIYHLMDSSNYMFNKNLLEQAHSEAMKLASIRVAKEQVKLNPKYLAQ